MLTRLPLHFSAFAMAIVLCLNVSNIATADEAKPDLEALAKQLDSDEFTERQAASEQLQALGKDAVPTLIKSAQHKSLEPRRRSFAILTELLKSDDAATKAAANKALEQLATSENNNVASAAKKALKPPAPERPAGFGNFNGAVQIQIGGGGMQAKVTDNNGVKTIEVQEAGKQVKIVEGPNGIDAQITQKDKNGKQKTTKVTAKDLDDLKKKSPELHGYYQKYGKQGGLRIAINGAGIAPRPVRINPIQFKIPGLVDPKDIASTDSELAKAIAGLQKVAETSKDAESINAAIKSLESARATIAKMKKGSDMSELSKRMREAHEQRRQQILP